MQLAVTIDTEGDRQWEPGIRVETRNAAFWEPFHELCLHHGVAPTYLVTTEIVEDDRARDLLAEWQSRGEIEIGAHLHPWTTPPYEDQAGLRYNDLEHAYPCQLPDDLLHAKIATLTEQITAAFGRSPTAYRSGRFGMDLRQAICLAQHGYLVDSSVTPIWSWRNWIGMGGEGGPDFREHSQRPFRIDGSGPDGLIEIPVSLFATYRLLRRWPILLSSYRSLPVRAVRRMLLSRWLSPQPVWLTPDPRYTDADLQAAWDCASQARLATAVMMFHSSELMPGGSPFRPHDASVDDLLSTLDCFFSHVRACRGGFSTLSRLATDLSANESLEDKPL